MTIEVSAGAGPLSRPKGEVGASNTHAMGEEIDASLANTNLSSTPPAETSVVVATSPKYRIELPQDPKERKALLDALYSAQRLAAHAANAVARALWKFDGQALDAFVATTGHRPTKGKDFPMPEGNWYAIARDAAPELSTSAASVIARDVSRKWAQTRWEALILQTQRPISYRDTYPIPLREAEMRLRLEQGRYIVDAPLFAGRNQRIEFVVIVKDQLEREIFTKLLSREWVPGASRIVRDRKNRWYIQLVYKRVIEKARTKQAAAINRGIKQFLMAVDEAGETWSVDGADIEAVLNQLGRRRRQLQSHAKTSGRAGRGRKRILKPLETLAAKGDRWRDTRCKTIAARFVQWLQDRGVGVLFIEDLQGIREGDLATEGGKVLRDRIHQWPYYRLQQDIQHRCSTAGIEVQVVSARYITQTCGACGEINAQNVDLKYWKMKCVSCGHRADLDANAARNVLARGLGKTTPPQGGGRGRQSKRQTRRVK